MSDSQIKTKILSKTDQTYFVKAIQCYYFFKQQTTNSVETEVELKLDEGASLVYSLLKIYLEKEQFEVAYLQEINELLKEVHSIVKEKKGTVLVIEPLQIGEIQIGELVPLVFTDAELDQTLQIMYNSKEGICIWSISKIEAT